MMLVRAYAKVNYALEVRGLRSDGYHEISTVMQSISLFDEVVIERGGRGFELEVEPEGVEIGPPEENTVYRAVTWMSERAGEELPVRVRLRKNIPVGAGLGGGSADAAAVLVGLSEVFSLPFGPEEGHLAAGIGADVPFCVKGGTALGEGIGEVLTPLPAPPEHYLAVAKPPAGASTARIYRAYDERTKKGVGSVVSTTEALRERDLKGLARAMGNDLAPVTEALEPEVWTLRRELLDAGALGAGMSGTGTAIYGVFGSEAGAREAADGLHAPFVGVYEPVGRGVEILRGPKADC